MTNKLTDRKEEGKFNMLQPDSPELLEGKAVKGGHYAMVGDYVFKIGVDILPSLKEGAFS